MWPMRRSGRRSRSSPPTGECVENGYRDLRRDCREWRDRRARAGCRGGCRATSSASRPTRWASRSSWGARPGRVSAGRCPGGSTSSSRATAVFAPKAPRWSARCEDAMALARARRAAWPASTKSASSAAARSTRRRCRWPTGCMSRMCWPRSTATRVSRRSIRKSGARSAAQDVPGRRKGQPCDALYGLRAAPEQLH